MNKPVRGRGRPPKLESRDVLLDVGKELLLTFGIRVTVDAIVAKAKVAKTTFYTYFTDKESFIEEVMLRESQRTISEQEFDESHNADLYEVLVTFGERYLTFGNEHRLLRWDQLIVSANDIYPELARRLYEAGPGRGYRLLTFILRMACKRGEINIDDPEAAAEDLCGLWYGFTVLQINLRVRAPMTPEEISLRAKRGVEQFFKLVR